jgi:hypothetical protein
MRRRLNRWPARTAPHLFFLIPELLMAAGPLVIAAVSDASGRRRFRMPDFFYGGQALIEGVMMRGRTTVAMSVRPPSGEIRTISEPLPAALSADRKLIRIPFLRGMFLMSLRSADRAAGSGSEIVRISPDGGRTLIATVVRPRIMTPSMSACPP